jgi:hypothetical protein
MLEQERAFGRDFASPAQWASLGFAPLHEACGYGLSFPNRHIEKYWEPPP